MRTPHRLFPLSLLAARSLSLSLTGIAILALASGGCRSDENSTLGQVEKIDGSDVTLDARGSSVDSEIRLDQRTVDEGAAGNGGNIRVTSSGGTVTVTSSSRTFVVPTQTFIGNGVTVRSGERRNMFGTQRLLAFLDVQAGGEVVLQENSVLQVTGDVRIAGLMRSSSHTGVIRQDGHSFHLEAGGTVVISGTIDVSGQNSRLSASEQGGLTDSRDFETLGGNGGEVFIGSGLDVVITGAVIAKGGSTENQSSEKSLAGTGGRIFLGASRDLFSSGMVVARAGNSLTNNVVPGPRGGDIQLVAGRNILLEQVSGINASGGQNSGPLGGIGGSVTIEAAVGNTSLFGFDVRAAGGPATFSEGSAAGEGGRIFFGGTILSLDAMAIDASGGDVVKNEGEIVISPATGIGGEGGTVTLSSGQSLTVDRDVAIHLMGGDSQGEENLEGGTGGTFQAASLNPPGVDFRGTVNFRGGNNFGGQEGPSGNACLLNASTESRLAVIGINDAINVGTCSPDQISSGGVVHDLDCDGATTTPSQLTAVLPAVLGVDFYRVFVTGTSVTISTTGEAGRNIDLFVGDGTKLGIGNPAVYQVASTGPDSSETITIDDDPQNDLPLPGSEPTLTSLLTEGFLAVMVAEQTQIVQTYTIDVTCP